MTAILALSSTTSSIIGLVILILDIVAIVSIVSGGKSVGFKVLWIVVVLLLPVIGMLLYFLVGRNMN